MNSLLPRLRFGLKRRWHHARSNRRLARLEAAVTRAAPIPGELNFTEFLDAKGAQKLQKKDFPALEGGVGERYLSAPQPFREGAGSRFRITPGRVF